MVTTQIIQLGAKRSNTNQTPHAVLAGDFMYLSGQTAKDRRTQQIIGATAVEQLQMIFANMRLILSAQSLELVNVVKLTVFLHKEENVSAFETALCSYFGLRQPACTIVTVNHLKDTDARVCLEAVAYVERD